MTDITGVLVRHNKYHEYVGEPDGIERYFQIATDNPETAVGLAEEYLELYEDPDHTTTGVSGHIFESGQLPGNAFYVADEVSGKRINSLSVTGDQEMDAVVTLELGDPAADRAADLMRRISRLTAGADSRYAAPYIERRERGASVDKTPPPYSLGQILYPSRSPAWSVPSPFWVSFMEVTLETAGSEPSVIRLFRNSEMIASCTIDAGEVRSVIKVKPETDGTGYATQDVGIMEIKIAGTDAANLAVMLRGAVIQSK